jgi:hypothetical protein
MKRQALTMRSILLCSTWSVSMQGPNHDGYKNLLWSDLYRPQDRIKRHNPYGKG